VTDALTVVGVFMFGLLLGGGIVGGCLGFWLGKEEWVIETLVRFLLSKPGLLELLATRVEIQGKAEARLERELLEMRDRIGKAP
jgi:hypothetical protein